MEYPDTNTAEAAPRQVPIRQVKKRKFGKVLLLILSYAIVGLVVWQVSTKIHTDPDIAQARTEAEVKELVEDVSKLIILPSDETPKVIPINDAENLAKNQLFFAKVQNGDQLLVFTSVQQAIIYRPSANKIVNTGPIITGDGEQAGAQSVSPAPSKDTDPDKKAESAKDTSSTPKKSSAEE